MDRRRTRAWILALTVCALACGGGTEYEPAEAVERSFEVLAVEAPAEAVERARAAADALGRDLVRHLSSALDGGSAIDAIRVCSEVAQEVSAAHATEGLRIRRVSLRARNPLDAPDPYEAAWLGEAEQRHQAGEAVAESVETVRADGEQALRLLRPIVMKDLCLNCHGGRDEMDAEVVAFLDEHYPSDRATGYASGDFRGAFSVAIQLD